MHRAVRRSRMGDGPQAGNDPKPEVNHMPEHTVSQQGAALLLPSVLVPDGTQAALVVRIVLALHGIAPWRAMEVDAFQRGRKTLLLARPRQAA